MSSTASPVPDSEHDVEPDLPFISGFAAEMQGRPAECDGGAPIVGTNYAGRQEFTGTLTGSYRDFGPYPWRWFLMAELTKKPPGYAYEAVWCDEGSLTMLDEQD